MSHQGCILPLAKLPEMQLFGDLHVVMLRCCQSCHDGQNGLLLHESKGNVHDKATQFVKAAMLQAGWTVAEVHAMLAMQCCMKAQVPTSKIF